ncbi:MAG TPA: hypothetical protein VHM90_06015, partial [Phycisphaerae bacterium]|nr:hypothetical protein [Phycisphaerae bacterium]
SVWNALGTWNPPQVPKDLEARILQSLPDHADRQVPKRHWRRYLQVAAALALAIGLGHLAGRLTWRPPAPEPASETAAAESLHLDDANSADILLAAVDSPEGDQP